MKSIVIYFSWADENYAVGNITKGNTEVIAEYISEFTGAELFRCDPAIPYSANYRECCKEAVAKQRSDARPELKRYLSDIDGYDAVYVGGPIYCGEYPQEIYSQLDRLDFAGKTVRPFVTHEGSGLARCVAVLKEKCAGATVADGLAVRGRDVYLAESKEAVRKWVESL